MGKQFVILGLSGAGKDTIAELLIKHRRTRCYNLKWSALAKTTLAQWYDVAEEYFTDPVKRTEQVPGENFTYLDVLVKAYHAWQEIDPKLTVRPTVKHIKTIISTSDIIYTDTRSLAEAEAIAQLAHEHFTHVIHVFGSAIEYRQSSDRMLEDIKYHLALNCPVFDYHRMYNGGSIRDLSSSLLINRLYD